MPDARNATRRWKCTARAMRRLLYVLGGYKEKLSAFQNRRKKEGAGVSKRDIQQYMKRQQKEANEPINNAFAAAFAKLNLETKEGE